VNHVLSGKTAHITATSFPGSLIFLTPGAPGRQEDERPWE